MIGNKIPDKITSLENKIPQNSSETVTNEVENIWFDREIHKER